MRQIVWKRPQNGIQIIRLATGEAIVRLYVSYVETPRHLSNGGGLFTANVLDTKVPDSPDLMLDAVHRFSYYYEKALGEEIEFLTGQYKRVVDDIIYKLPPGKREAVSDKADEIIRQIANGDKPFLTQQEFGKILKYCI